MMVFAALQVHQTRTALVQREECDGPRGSAVRFFATKVFLNQSIDPETGLRRIWITLATSTTISRRRTMYYRCIVVLHVVLDQKALCGVWVWHSKGPIKRIGTKYQQMGHFPRCRSQPQDEEYVAIIIVSRF